MKTFDINLAMQGKPVCTRDGKPARIICFDRKNKDYPIVAFLGEDENVLMTYNTRGFAFGTCTNADLMMVGEHHEGWINIYKTRCLEGDSIRESGGNIHNTKEEAEKAKEPYSSEYITTIKIEWEE